MNNPKAWYGWLPWVEYWYNTTYHVSINTTPFNIVYGTAALPLISYEENKVSNDAVEQQLMARDKALVALKEHLGMAQNRMKKIYDSKRGRLNTKWEMRSF